MLNRKLFIEWAMAIAEETKSRSTCVSRQVGTVIVKNKQIISTGYNGAPMGCIHCTDIGYCERKKRGIPSGQGLEICRAGHSESNAIDQCARHGVACQGATMITTTLPCSFCGVRIIQAGISELIYKEGYPNGLPIVLFEEAGVKLTKYEDALAAERVIEERKQIEVKKKIELFENTPRKY